MKILFIGGTGIISSACASLAIKKGLEVTLLVRGQSERPVPAGARILSADIRQAENARALLGSEHFDVIADFVAFTPAHIETDLELLGPRTRQLIFISSASAYQKPPRLLPITESTPLANPFWSYSRDKIACEERLMRAYREEGVPVTIVRPSHTYDERLIPLHGGYTTLARIRRKQPIVVHGDGTSLWVLTHHRDFAAGFVGLLANPAAIGEAVHITSDELLTWNEIVRLLAAAAGTEPRIAHIPSWRIARENARWGDSLLGDKSHSVIFDNTKIRRLVPGFQAGIPFARGAEEIVSFYEQHPEFQRIDPQFDALLDRLSAECGIC